MSMAVRMPVFVTASPAQDDRRERVHDQSHDRHDDRLVVGNRHR